MSDITTENSVFHWWMLTITVSIGNQQWTKREFLRTGRRMVSQKDITAHEGLFSVHGKRIEPNKLYSVCDENQHFMTEIVTNVIYLGEGTMGDFYGE